MESNHCRNLYQDASSGEREGYEENFRNTWSVANTGYYTHPLPVLSNQNVVSGGTEDIDKVTTYTPTYSSLPPIIENGWIYGTAKPPWSLEYTEVGSTEKSWDYKKTLSTLTKMDTPSTFNAISVDTYSIDGIGASPNITFSGMSLEIEKFLDYVEEFSNVGSFTYWMKHHTNNRYYRGDHLVNIIPDPGGGSDINWYYHSPITKKMTGEDIYKINTQDSILFDAYYRYRRGDFNSISEGLNPDVNLNPIYKKYYESFSCGAACNNPPISDHFTTSEINDFKRWNEKIQTSTINFNRESGIQLRTSNRPIERSAYIDTFCGGTIYNTNFLGIWSGGSWLQGFWNGWNDLKSSGHELETPEISNISSTNIKIPYYENKEYLIKEKKYYDIAPWDTTKKDDLIISKNIKRY